MKNSREANRLTEQRPQDCKHYAEYKACLYRNADVVLGRGQKACTVARSGRYCPDFTPKPKKQ